MEGRTPVHLWIVGVLATFWNAFGCFDYLMTQTRNEQYLANFTDPQRVYFESFPVWMEAAWACGVWGGLPARCCCSCAAATRWRPSPCRWPASRSAPSTNMS